MAKVRFWPFVSLPESVMSFGVSSFVEVVWLAAVGAAFATKFTRVFCVPFSWLRHAGLTRRR